MILHGIKNKIFSGYILETSLFAEGSQQLLVYSDMVKVKRFMLVNQVNLAVILAVISGSYTWRLFLAVEGKTKGVNIPAARVNSPVVQDSMWWQKRDAACHDNTHQSKWHMQKDKKVWRTLPSTWHDTDHSWPLTTNQKKLHSKNFMVELSSFHCFVF